MFFVNIILFHFNFIPLKEDYMKKEIYSWLSPNIKKEMKIGVYGYYGYALLMFPTADSDYSEYEKFGLIDSISNFINSGTLKSYVVNSLNMNCWLNKHMHPAEKGVRHQQYNAYIEDEVIPFIRKDSNSDVPIIACGISLGALLAANAFFRRPDLFAGLITLSGVYDLKPFSDGYYDDNCYFNSPVDYLPNLNDENTLNQMRNKSIIIACGKGNFEEPNESINLSNILNSKGINHWIDLWGHDMHHDWPTWHKMLPYFLQNINV